MEVAFCQHIKSMLELVQHNTDYSNVSLNVLGRLPGILEEYTNKPLKLAWCYDFFDVI